MVPFLKMEAVGNDFVLLQEQDAPESDWRELALRMCERRFGIGADGLLVLGESDRADFRLRMFNPDGTEDHCGNGMRCAALAFAGEASAGQERRITLETLDGLKRARVFERDGGTWIETEMGEPRFAPADLPMMVEGDCVVDYPLKVDGETVPVTVISMGTTHTVLFMSESEVEGRFERLSPVIGHHPLYPERTSVLWATVKRPDRLRLRIWERGAGETLGCGTGACAAMVAARLHGFVGDRTTVASPGGELIAEWPGQGPVRLTGQAHQVYEGVWSR